MSNLNILPPRPGQCPICAVKHDEELPHDATSFYYQFLFSAQWKRSPTWNDAMAHCSIEIQQRWKAFLNHMDIDPNSTDVKGSIKTQGHLDARLKTAEERE